MVDTNKVQEAMHEVDRQFESVRPMITTTARANGNGQGPATLLSWLKRFDEKQDELAGRQRELDQKLNRIITFLGGVEK